MPDKLPLGAKPGIGGKLLKINPYDKKLRSVGLNLREESNLQGICSYGATQLLDCYAYRDEACSCFDFIHSCNGCPHFVANAICWDPENRNLWNCDWALKWLEERMYLDYDDPKYFVYFISDGEYVKIGKRSRRSDRLGQLQTGNPNDLRTLFEIPLISEKAAAATERFLHRAFSDYRRTGEWFDIKKKLNQRLWLNTFRYF